MAPASVSEPVPTTNAGGGLTLDPPHLPTALASGGEDQPRPNAFGYCVVVGFNQPISWNAISGAMTITFPVRRG
jgi:hypothetical protein